MHLYMVIILNLNDSFLHFTLQILERGRLLHRFLIMLLLVRPKNALTESKRWVMKIMLGIYGGVAQKGTTLPLAFGLMYLFMLLISVYFMRSRYTFINYPFNKLY